MTAKRRLTRPGLSDNEYMTVTCTPDTTTVEFFELPEEAEAAARDNIVPTATTYFGKVLKQGEHAIRGTSKHIAIVVEVDPELAAAIRKHSRVHGRKQLASFFQGILSADLEQIRSEYQAAQARKPVVERQDEHTHPGAPVEPPRISCHPGLRCTNWPDCESCGPARL